MTDRPFTRKKRTAPEADGKTGNENRIIRHLRDRGLKITKQRLLLARIFQEIDHVTVGELHERAIADDPAVGRITVYRFLKLLCRLGLSRERHFEDGLSRFDNILSKDHHDHMICERCGRIVEFTCDRIEQLQEEITRSRGFLIRGHRLEIRGLCRNCR